MPPVRTRKSRPASKAKSKRKFPSRTRRVYRKSATSTRGTQNMLAIKSLTPKVIQISVPYIQTLRFTSMGKSDSTAPFKQCVNSINIDLNYPLSTNIVFLNDATGANPTADKTNVKLNLQDELAPYFEQYARAVTKSSNVSISWNQKMNQEKYEQYFFNQPVFNNQPAHLIVKEKEFDSLNYAMYCTSTSANNTNNNPLIIATNLYDLKNKVTGMNMRRMICGKHTARQVTFKSTYTPKKVYEYKDLDDNLSKLQFDYTNQIATAPNRRAYGHSGVCISEINNDVNINKQGFFDVSVKVVYNLEFYRRINEISAGNQPLAHAGTPREQANQGD